MDSTNSQNRTLEIEGMTGPVCVQKVTDALKTVPGVTTNSVKIGGATITADDASATKASAAVTAAGYKAHESGNKQPDSRPTQHPTSGEQRAPRTDAASPAVVVGGGNANSAAPAHAKVAVGNK